jgi:hypothetical protein
VFHRGPVESRCVWPALRCTFYVILQWPGLAWSDQICITVISLFSFWRRELQAIEGGLLYTTAESRPGRYDFTRFAPVRATCNLQFGTGHTELGLRRRWRPACQFHKTLHQPYWI